MGEKESCASKYQKEIENLNYEFESQKNEVKQYEEEISIKKESIKESHARLDAVIKENCSLQNKIKDLESLNSNLQNNSEELSQYMDQSTKINTLERENRTLISEFEFLK